jgi:ribosome-associated protein
VEAVLVVEATGALTDVQKRRVIARLGPVLRAIAQDERSQSRNKELATDRLAGQLREALKVPRRRRPTKPSKAAVERRIEAKKRRSQTKRLRRPPD